MKKAALILTIALTACTAKAPLSEQVVRSEMARCPQASFLDGREGTLKWNYTTGLELKAFLDVYCHSDLSSPILSYVDAWYDAIIDSTGSIRTYKLSNYSTDHICPGRTLFSLYDITGKEKYRRAMDTLYLQLQQQPRTEEGNFWHKAIYPDQVWLDGLYMAQPFYAEYTARFVADSLEAADNYADIVNQFVSAYSHTLDPETGLLRHAWDSSREMFWSDPVTGQSAHVWGRALGWYCMALADVIPVLPDGEGKDTLIGLMNSLFETIPLFADAHTGMWYQVMDSPYRTGNYQEATSGAMFCYAMLRGVRLGFLGTVSRSYAVQAFEDLRKAFVRTDDDGLVNLDSCCEVAGLGGKENRSGDYDYYIHEPVRSNDPKGMGPLIWAALEYEML